MSSTPCRRRHRVKDRGWTDCKILLLCHEILYGIDSLFFKKFSINGHLKGLSVKPLFSSSLESPFWSNMQARTSKMEIIRYINWRRQLANHAYQGKRAGVEFLFSQSRLVLDTGSHCHDSNMSFVSFWTRVKDYPFLINPAKKNWERKCWFSKSGL